MQAHFAIVFAGFLFLNNLIIRHFQHLQNHGIQAAIKKEKPI
jgi:hypothetical protein